jgi:hypothetical protein
MAGTQSRERLCRTHRAERDKGGLSALGRSILAHSVTAGRRNVAEELTAALKPGSALIRRVARAAARDREPQNKSAAPYRESGLLGWCVLKSYKLGERSTSIARFPAAIPLQLHL